MLVLVIDTATPAITAAVASIDSTGVDVLAERVTVDSRAHGERLSPAIAEVLGTVGKSAADLGAVIAGVGPGPFTGLRVGLVTAAALGDALGIPTYGAVTLDALGREAGPGRMLVATDARRKEIYWAVYEGSARLGGPEVGKPADVAAAGGELDGACGDGAVLYEAVLGLPLRPPRYPSAASLATLAATRVLTGAPGEVLTPMYLRRPDAVEPAARKPVS